MKFVGYVMTVAAFALWPVAASAAPLFLSGTIGGAPVIVMLQKDGAEISGWYLYLRHGKDIRLDGKIDAAGNFTLDETNYPSSIVTGVLQGNVNGARWAGTWRKPAGGAAVALALNENRDTLSASDGRLFCTAKQFDRQSGFRFAETVALTVAHGDVRHLTVSHIASRAGEDQQCSIGLPDLDRASSPTGVLLRAKGDDPTAHSAHCTVHVIPAGDYLYVKLGDFTEDGNDCMGVGDDVRFCSPRGNFNDIIIDRRTNTCTMVQ